MVSKAEIKTRLQQAGYSLIHEYNDPANEEFPEHVHEREEMAVIIDGSLEVSMNGVDYVLKPGDTLVFPAKTSHSAKVGPAGCVYLVGEKACVVSSKC